MANYRFTILLLVLCCLVFCVGCKKDDRNSQSISDPASRSDQTSDLSDSKSRTSSGNTTVVSISDSKLLSGHQDFVRGVAVSPDGKWVASAGDDLAILWNAADGTPQFKFEPESGNKKSCAVTFSPDGKTLAVRGFPGGVSIWNVASGKLETSLEGPSLFSVSLTYSADGSLLATTHDEEQIMLFDVKQKKPMPTLSEKGEKFKAVAFTSHANDLLSMSYTKLVIWDVTTSSKSKVIDGDFKGASDQWRAIACSPSARLFAATRLDGLVKEQRSANFPVAPKRLYSQPQIPSL
jgi:WD40 repeat protein